MQWHELAKTSWASPEDMDTAGRRGNPSQLETDVAETAEERGHRGESSQRTTTVYAS